jgi:hypothetical protein
VQGPTDPKRIISLSDLTTVSDALGYIGDDLEAVPGLERATELLRQAAAEIDAAGRRRLAPLPRSIMHGRLGHRRKH